MLRVVYKDWVHLIPDIYLSEFSVRDLHVQVLKHSTLLYEQNKLKMPENPHFHWATPGKSKDRLPLATDGDWNSLMNAWNNYKYGDIIPIYMVDSSKPSDVQIGIQKLHEWESNNVSKKPLGSGSYVMTSQPSHSEACQWADNLILTQPFDVSQRESQNQTQTSCVTGKVVVGPSRKKLDCRRREKSPVKNSSSIDKGPLSQTSRQSKRNPAFIPPRPLTTVPIKAKQPAPSQMKSPEQVSKRKSFASAQLDAVRSLREPDPLVDFLDGIIDYVPEAQPDIPEWDIFLDPEVPQGGSVEGGSGEGVEGNDVEDGGVVLESEDDEADEDYCENEEELESEEDGDYSSDDSDFGDEDVDLEAENEYRMSLLCDQVEDGEASHCLKQMSQVYRKGRVWSRSVDGRVHLLKGDIFSKKVDLVNAMKEFCLQEGFKLKKLHHDSKRYTMKCQGNKCTWRFHASVSADKETWMVKYNVGTHRCQKFQRNSLIGKRWLAAHMLPEYRLKPDMSADYIIRHIQSRFGTPVHKTVCYRALGIMRICVEGSHAQGYALLPQYVEQYRLKNPTSFTLCNWIEQEVPRNPMFVRVVICIGPSIQAFKENCRPLIGIDVCHLKGPFKGILLTVMGLDGNNGQFPLSYAVAEAENDEEWGTFLSSLHKALGAEPNCAKYTFISDRHKSIISSLQKVFPKAQRRICVLHFYKNFAATYAGAWFHSAFYTVANGYSEVVYRRGMEAIKMKNEAAFTYLDKEPKAHWSRHAFDKTLRSADNTNNFVESFNAVIARHIGKPCLTMLECLRRIIGARFHTRYQNAFKWDDNVTPYVRQKLDELTWDSKNCLDVIVYSESVIEVVEGSTGLIINLDTRTCDCGRWQITGVPCKHALRALNHLNVEVTQYCDDYFSTEKYKALYNTTSFPVQDSHFWPPSDLPKLDPPNALRKLGRPEKHARKDGHDWTPVADLRVIHGVKTCKLCGKLGHNSRGCKKPRDEYGQLIRQPRKKRKGPPEPKPANQSQTADQSQQKSQTHTADQDNHQGQGQNHQQQVEQRPAYKKKYKKQAKNKMDSRSNQ